MDYWKNDYVLPLKMERNQSTFVVILNFLFGMINYFNFIIDSRWLNSKL